jgi:hypothetical protein
MNRTRAIAIASILLSLAMPVVAGPTDALLAEYAAACKAGAADFSGFSAQRGKAMHTQNFTGGKPDTPSCSTCHGEDPRQAGRSRTGKSIDPMALSASPGRYADAAKVEKWFRRNCKEVLGRECSPQEKGDWLTYMGSR